MGSWDMLSQLIFVRKRHQTACCIKERTLEHASIFSMLWGHMPRQMILPLERVRALGACERPCVLMDRLNVRVPLARLAEVIPAKVTLVLHRRWRHCVRTDYIRSRLSSLLVQVGRGIAVRLCGGQCRCRAVIALGDRRWFDNRWRIGKRQIAVWLAFT